MNTIVLTDQVEPGKPVGPNTHHVLFFGKYGEFASLLIKGFLLQLVTLGIYRFWFLTRQRRFFWNNTEIAGDPLEYTGTGKELFIGFLFALAVMVPIWALFYVALLWAGINEILVNAGFVLVASFLIHFAIYRARRYRLTRTIWRGVRCWQDGSGGAYAIRAFGWDVLNFITLGLSQPFAEANLERYRMRHTHYGDAAGSFHGSGGTLFLRLLPSWAIVALPVIALMAMALAKLDIGALSTLDGLEGFEDIAGMSTVISALVGAFYWLVLVGMLVHPWRQAIRFRWWADGTRIGEVSMTSNLEAAQIYGNWLRYIGWGIAGSLAVIVVAMLVVIIVSVLASGMPDLAGVFQGDGEPPAAFVAVFIVLAVIFYAAILCATMVNYMLCIVLRLWRQSCLSLSLNNLDSLRARQVKRGTVSGFGEGLMDALDAGGF